MDKKIYELDFLSKAGPYSHIVEAGEFLFLSGMLPVNIERNIIVTGDIKKASDLCLSNIQRALEHVGSSMQKIVKITVFLKDIACFNDMNEIYKTYFPDNPPARTCVAVKAIPGDFPVEIDVIVIK